ncbi:MAG: hypothetical protein P4L84_35020 [Isosphaeraceae bacterium]|nr:hypothetical protein [Isosphaeraceae bacterium]
MALRKPLVVGGDGRPQQLQAGDTLTGPFAENETQNWTNGDSAGHSIGNVVYLSAGDTVKRAQANAAGTSGAVAIATGTIAAGAVGGYQTNGTLSGLTGLTAGATYYLDPAAVGGMTTTCPTTVGQLVCILGIAVSATEFLIRIREPIQL